MFPARGECMAAHNCPAKPPKCAKDCPGQTKMAAPPGLARKFLEIVHSLDAGIM
jgi:hypothetical protein